ISAQIQQDAASSQWQIAVLEGVILLCGVAFAVLLTRSITRPVHAALAISQRVAAGDLTSRAVSVGQDELGQLVTSLQGMSERLHGVVSTV
ncbi:HAMP domain-containing protein, partial [Klebsiella pneumoniae]|nr:HAMP domain-containing protein [Klebsiella pneumoniae]